MDDEKKLMTEWLHRWGGANSEAAFDLKFQFFHIPAVDGFIGYGIKSGYAVVFGDPVCSVTQQSILALAFQQHCRELGVSYMYVTASAEFAEWAMQNVCAAMLEIGDQVVFNPMKDPIEGAVNAKLRNKIHHAQSQGLKVDEYISNDLKMEEAIYQVGVSWLKSRRGPQLHLGKLNFFDDRIGKRWFYVQQGDHLIGMALLSSLEAYQGWLLKFLIVAPEAPRGTSEFLMVSILEKLREEDCHFLTYGTVPGEQLGAMVGLSKLSSCLIKNFYKTTQWIFKLKNRRKYWDQFHPESRPSYLLFSGSSVGLKEARSLLKTFYFSF